MGSTIGFDPLILGCPSFVASGVNGLWGRLLLSETDGLQILTEYVEVAYVPFGEETWFWDTLLKTFYTLWYWFFTTMLLMLPSASFLRKSSKHSKAQILHPMKTIISTRVRAEHA